MHGMHRVFLSPCSGVGALGALGTAATGEMIMFLRLDRVDDNIPPPDAENREHVS